MDKEQILKSITAQFQLKELETTGGKKVLSVYTPFMYGDGDGYEIFVGKDDSGEYITDLGCTISRCGPPENPLLLDMHRATNHNGELRVQVENGNYGEAIFELVRLIADIDARYEGSYFAWEEF